MPRQRLRERTSPLVIVGRLVTLVFALALVWYGLMTLLLALKVSSATVNSLSGYRTAFDWLSGLTPRDVDGGADPRDRRRRRRARVPCFRLLRAQAASAAVPCAPRARPQPPTIAAK